MDRFQVGLKVLFGNVGYNVIDDMLNTYFLRELSSLGDRPCRGAPVSPGEPPIALGEPGGV